MVRLKTQNDLEIALRQNMWLREVLERFEEIVLPDSWLVAGAIAQTIWNLRCEQPAEFGLKDVDLIYFDEQDLSFEAEASHERRLRDLFQPKLPHSGKVLSQRHDAWRVWLSMRARSRCSDKAVVWHT
jgi:hypothetical protein